MPQPPIEETQGETPMSPNTNEPDTNLFQLAEEIVQDSCSESQEYLDASCVDQDGE